LKRIAHTTPWVATGDQAMPSVTLLRRQGEAGGEERMVSVISDLVHTMTDQTNLTLDIDTTLIVSEKGDGQTSYKGFRGYKPLIGMCVDLGLDTRR